MNEPTKEILELTAKVNNLTQGCRFISITYKAKKTGEIARHTLLVGFSYHELVIKSKEELTPILADIKAKHAEGKASDLELEAAMNVMESLDETLDAHLRGEQNDKYTKKGMYAPIRNGVNINLNDNSIQLFGMSRNKVILMKGEYKIVKSRPLTIAQNKINKQLSRSKFREFAFDPLVILSGKINGETLDCVTPECFGMELTPVVLTPEEMEQLI
jgi:hypothetical protein